MLKLPVPEADYEDIVLNRASTSRTWYSPLADRAEQSGTRESAAEHRQYAQDNQREGKKLALDQRLINDMLPDEEIPKPQPVYKAFEIWEQTKAEVGAAYLL